jgi:CHASE2 domain-containing sensor protein
MDEPHRQADCNRATSVSKIAILEFTEGSFEQGFVVTLRIGDEGAPTTTKVTAKLPPNPDIPLEYAHWRSIYTDLISNSEIASRPTCLPKQTPPTVTRQDCEQAAQRISTRLNQWLCADDFLPILKTWLMKLQGTDDLRVLLQTQDGLLQKLPWHLWDLFIQYPQAELALTAPEYDTVTPSLITAHRIKILAILGNSSGIDITADRQALEQVAGAAVKFLPEPALKDLTDELWQQPWRILFFAGHSSSHRTQGQEGTNVAGGKFTVNATESLSISQLKYALRSAVQRGLQLAIFNSCDGLDIAKELAELQIPQLIVMREPVPDAVAQAFLTYFLQAFSQGTSLHQSLRQARERLQSLENHYPCATWLPILYQNPAAVPITWQALMGSPRPKRWQSIFEPMPRMLWVMGISTIVTASIVFGRALGWLQPLELQAFDQLMRRRPAESVDSRVLIVGIDNTDVKTDEMSKATLPPQERGSGSISNAALGRLLAKLTPHQPRLIGLDIYRDFPANDQPAIVKQLQQMPNLVAVCRSSDTPGDIPGVKPPPGITDDQLGFADFVVDPDGVIRRHLLFMDVETASPCAADYAFSVQLATRYLTAQGFEWTFTPDGNLQLGQQKFPRIQSHDGGYANIDADGNQVLLNYRQSPTAFDQVTLRQILNGEVLPSAIKDRIILIGYTGKGVNDYTPTPYGPMPGVLVHAHMLSQILNAVTDQRSLLWNWSQPLEIAWIGAWAIVSGALMNHQLLIRRSLPRMILVSVISCGGVCIICYYVMTQGGWIPLVPPCAAIAATALGIRLTHNQSIRRIESPAIP